MSFQSFLLVFLSAFSLPSWSLTFDWSGWSRMEAYYQHSPSKNYYGNYHFVLNPDIQVLDGLNLVSRLDLKNFGESSFAPSSYYRQSGLVFLYNDKDLKIASPFLSLSQIYIDYQNEFFKIRVGRAPYHFGMGLTYLASKDPLNHWISVYNQVSLYLEYSQFYLQPGFLQKEGNSFLALLQAGIHLEALEASLLLQYDLKENSLAEAFGHYKKDNLEVKASASYAFKDETHLLAAVEALVPIPSKIPVQVELKAGMALGDLLFHPGYNVALLLGNRAISAPKEPLPGESSSPSTDFQVAEGQIEDRFYFSPSLLFTFLGEDLKVRPLVVVARSFENPEWTYEGDLKAMYNWSENFFLSLTAGALYEKEELQWAVLGQAAVSF